MSGGGASSSSSSLPGGPMMQLKTENMILLEELRKRLDPEAPPNKNIADIRISDFDGEFAPTPITSPRSVVCALHMLI